METKTNPDGFVVWDSGEPWAQGVAAHVCEVLRSLRSGAGSHGALEHPLSIGLSGGNSPIPANRALGRMLSNEAELASRCRWFQVDERWVGRDHPDRNGRMIRETLFPRGWGNSGWEEILPPEMCALEKYNTCTFEGSSPVSANVVLRPPADCLWAAREYAERLTRMVQGRNDGVPVFDLLLLGVGEDGHTASLFPGTEDQIRPEAIFQPVWVEKLRSWRLTLTMPVLVAAKHVAVLTTGSKKAALIRSLANGGERELPMGRLIAARQARGASVEWWLDTEAAQG